MKITKLYLTKSTPAHYVAQIAGNTSETDGLFLLPCTPGGASQDMERIHRFEGNSASLEEVPPYLVMSMAFGGYPIEDGYYEAAKAANSEHVRK